MLETVCGSLVGLTHFIFGQPLDFIKVKYQTADSKPNLQSITDKWTKQIIGHTNATKNKDVSILKIIAKLYTGGSSLILGLPIATAVKFGTYEYAKKSYMRHYRYQYGQTPEQILKLTHIALSGLISGFISSLVYSPLQYIKIQKQTAQPINFSNIHKGIGQTLIRQSLGTQVYFLTYQTIVRELCFRRKINRRFAQYGDFLIGGAGAGFVYWALLYPIDTIKTRIQANFQNQTNLNNQATFPNQGNSTLMKNLYRGYSFAVLRGTIINAIGFSIYEQAKGFSQLLMYFSNA